MPHPVQTKRKAGELSFEELTPDQDAYLKTVDAEQLLPHSTSLLAG